MATTIVTKSGSGAPTASNLVAGELAVDLTNKRLYTENSSGTVLELGTNPASDVTFGDNTKAVFGDGSDLRIYHTGSHSTIENIGTGHLQIHTTDFRLKDSAGTESMILANADGNVQLYYNNAEKLATTATGIDVTGTVTADGVDSQLSGSGGLPVTSGTAQTYGSLRVGATSFNTILDMGSAGASGAWLQASDKTALGTNYSLLLNPNGGNVGIGCTPSVNTEIRGSATNGQLRLGGSTTATYANIYSDNDGVLILGADAGNNAASSYFGVEVDGTERMRIDASGNVGIGTSSPTHLLQISGGASDGRMSFTNNARGNGQSDGMWVGVDNSQSYLLSRGEYPLTFYTNATERMRITSGGALEIGPAANKVIIKSQGSFQNTTLESHIINADGTGAYGSGDVLIQPRCSSVSSNNIVFGTSGGTNTTTERMRIDASGNFFVGATALAADANFFGTSPGNAFSDFGHITGVASGVSYTRFLYAGSVIGSITQSGTIAVLYNTSSDQRLKENIADADDAGSKIDAIQVRKFDWKADGSHQDYGMIAQELQTVAPEAVSGDPDSEEMMGVDYSKLVPMMLKEIQSLRARVSELES
jgi:hypothetical protein